MVAFIAEADKAAYREYYSALVRATDRWRFEGEQRVEDLTINRIDVINGETVNVETCEWSNISRIKIHDPNDVYDDERVSSGFESTIKTQVWIREGNEWKATIYVDRQVVKKENLCEN